MSLALAASLLLSFGLMGFGAWLIVLGQRANEPRWAIRLSWLLGIELSLAGLGVLAVAAHAVIVFVSTR